MTSCSSLMRPNPGSATCSRPQLDPLQIPIALQPGHGAYFRTTLFPVLISFPASTTTSGVRRSSVPTSSRTPSLSNNLHAVPWLVTGQQSTVCLWGLAYGIPSTGGISFHWGKLEAFVIFRSYGVGSRGENTDEEQGLTAYLSEHPPLSYISISRVSNILPPAQTHATRSPAHRKLVRGDG